MLEIKEKILYIYFAISLSNKIEKNTHFTLNFFEKIKQKKIDIFKQVVAETMAGAIKKTSDNDILIEEKSISATDNEQQKEEAISEVLTDNRLQSVEEEQEKPNLLQENMAEMDESTDKEEEPPKEETIYDEYIVKEGDTLAAICKSKYGTLSNIQEICSINNIKNADYIEPGQKIYLPR